MHEGILEAWERLTDVYRKAVGEAYTGEVFFVDPKKFTGDSEHDVKALAQMYKEQFPDERQLDPNNPDDVQIAKELIANSQELGPFAIRLGDENCIVNEPDESFSTKEKIISQLTEIDEEELKQIPGTTEDYIRYIGLHEGTHCGDSREHDTDSQVLAKETLADWYAKQHFTNGFPDETSPVATTINHARAIAASSDPEHATSLPLNDIEEGETPNYPNSINLAQSYEDRLHEIVAEHVGLSGVEESQELYFENPELFFDVVDNFVVQGHFDENPDLKAAVIDLSKAERALKDFDEAGLGYEDHDMDYEVKAAEAIKDNTEPTIPNTPSPPVPSV